MPQVPYQPIPTVKPSQEGIRGISLSTPGTAFGTAVAGAIEHLGRTVEGAGDEMFKRAQALQELQNETEARNANAALMKQTAAMQGEFNARQGLNAGPEALEAHNTALEGVRDKIRAGLSNDMARKMFDANAVGFIGREMFNAAVHSGQQVKQAASQSIDASIGTTLSRIGQEDMDDATYEHYEKTVKSEMLQAAALHGWDGAKTKEMIDKGVSSAYANRLTQLAKTQPTEALRLFEENRAKLRDQDRDRVENSIRTQVRTTAARQEAADINADLADPTAPHPSLEERYAEARARAAKVDSEDKQLPAYFEREVEIGYLRFRRSEQDQENRQILAADAAIRGEISPDGKRPTSVAEFRAISPEMDTLWNAASPKMHAKIEKALANNIKDDYRWTDEGRQWAIQMRGMASTDPKKFVDEDVMAHTGVPWNERLALNKLQGRLRLKAEEDPRVGRAIKELGGDMLNAGISKTADPAKYYQWTGAIQDEMAAYQEENLKPMPREEILKMGSRLLQNFNQPTFFGLFTAKTPFYQLEVPGDLKEQIKADIQKRGGFTPTDDQIRRAYIQRRYQKEFEGKE